METAIHRDRAWDHHLEPLRFSHFAREVALFASSTERTSRNQIVFGPPIIGFFFHNETKHGASLSQDCGKRFVVICASTIQEEKKVGMLRRRLVRMRMVGIVVMALVVSAVETHVSEQSPATRGSSHEDFSSPREPLWLDTVSDRSPADVRRAGVVIKPSELDSFIAETMETYHIPAVSACAVKSGEIVWTGAYGYANIAEDIRVADSTLFMLASVSKTITGLALMQLWDEGLFRLDDDINAYLPFDVVNPNFPDSTITFRMLFAHTSSLNDNWSVMNSTYVSGDSPIHLSEYVRDYFTPGGAYYDASANFNTWPPGTRWDYCNHGFVLIGYLVETITGTPFDQYCQDSIFVPLGMNETSWFLEGLNIDNVAMPYEYIHGRYHPYGHFGYADYPAGALRTNTLQLARFLIAFMQWGRIDDVRILDSTTVEMMTTIQYPELSSIQGLVWFRGNVGGRQVWRHGGGDRGVSTMLAFCPDEHSGAVVLTNGESPTGTNRITLKLFEFTDDDDEDGVVNGYDNCPDIHNPYQEDSDGDGVGDACEGRCGDVNEDGSIDIVDVLGVVNHILGTVPLLGEVVHLADCDGNGEINVLDVMGIVNVILGTGTCGP